MKKDDCQRYIKIDGEEIYVTEEVYRAFKRPAWRERKRKDRESRCLISDGKGTLKKCTSDCKQCKSKRTGSPLSIDRFAEDGYEVSTPDDMAETLAYRTLLDSLFKALEELSPDERELVEEVIVNERSQRSYASELGISHQAVGKRLKKVLNKLRNLIEPEI